ATPPSELSTLSLHDALPIFLVDHNEFQQSAKDIGQANILKVVDHHRIANFQTESPLCYRAEPVGCTATILHKMYKENDLEDCRRSEEHTSELQSRCDLVCRL